LVNRNVYAQVLCAVLQNYRLGFTLCKNQGYRQDT
jgi:hypothetical protein